LKFPVLGENTSILISSILEIRFKKSQNRAIKNYSEKDGIMHLEIKWESKQSIREWMWDKMTKDQIARFPLPCYGRIPNFAGVETASKLLLNLPEFKKANLIFSAPDFVLHPLREMVLQNRKDLLMATPHIKAFLLLRDIVPQLISKAVTIKEMYKYGTEIKLTQISHKIGLFCQGSVAVDQKGNRLGKGKGYGDQEFQILQSEGLIDKQTVVLTVVHDMQILDDFSYLMESRDIKVQIILTPKEVIRLGF
jgi:5-formyltetrahydrofolate cyclo-ligase